MQPPAPQSRTAVCGIIAADASKFMGKPRRQYRLGFAQRLQVGGAGNEWFRTSLRNEKVVKLSVSYGITEWNPHTEAGRRSFDALGVFTMNEHVTLLIRLGQIAGEPCSCEERASHALALLNAYTARLYARVGIGGSNRLAKSAKSFADQTLADLRRDILLTEVHAADPCRRIFTAVRHRIEMARRVLASRIAEEGIPELSAPEIALEPEHLSYASAAPHAGDDAQSIDADTMASQHKIPAHRPCRRARLGNLSGQLTM
jgi:hypothetical protein